MAKFARRRVDDHDATAALLAQRRCVGAERLSGTVRWPIASAGRSLSIPTWFYGHEPTNVFATEIAKYFSNALREDTLLHRCGGGVVFLPGGPVRFKRSSKLSQRTSMPPTRAWSLR